MQLEFHRLDRQWEHLRVHEPRQQHHLLASLAENGQQTPIVVVADEGHLERYVVIDGFKRIAALQQLGRDTVEVTVWAMSEAEALLLERSLRISPQETALEQGWLLAEIEQRFHYSLEELARRFDRSVSWVSRRLALVELLPEAIQEQVRTGKIAAQIAMRYLAPVARVSLADCERMTAVFVEHHCDSRQAGQLYAAWRKARGGARTHPGRAGPVSEDATYTSGDDTGGGGTAARTGDGGSNPASRQPAVDGGSGTDERPATGTDTAPDRKRAARTEPDDGTFVLDESHLYAGTLAAELTLLMRRILIRCSRKPEETLHITTSATLAGVYYEGTEQKHK
jgi:ParB/RepB/Spo0J family partition protein